MNEAKFNAETNENQQAAQNVLADETAIRSAIEEIDNAIDAKDWALARTCFAEKINIDFTSLDGGEPAQTTADALVDGWQESLYAEKKSFHLRGNHRIAVSGNQAKVSSKAYAVNAIDEGAVSGIWEVWGDYEHTLEKTPDGWKVTGMTLKVVKTRGDDRIRTYLPNEK